MKVIRYIYRSAVILVAAASAFGCTGGRDQDTVGAEVSQIVLRTNVSVDPAELDTYVTKLRLIGFGRDDGSLACNTLYSPVTPAADGTVELTEKVRGTGVDLYVIANETDAMTAKLDYVYDKAHFLALPEVSRIEFTPGWEPTADAPFLMSDFVDVSTLAAGDAPVSVSASLKRMQSRLTLSIKNEYSAEQVQNGKTYRAVIKVSEVRLKKVPKYQSAVVPQEDYVYEYLANDMPLELASGGVYPEGVWEDVHKPVYLPEHLLTDNDLSDATVVCFKAERSFVNTTDPGDIIGVTTKQYVVPIQAPLGAEKGMDYSVRRNNHYKMQCRITKWDEGPIVTSEVVPWNFQVVEVEFDTADFEVVPQDVHMQDGHPVVVGVGGRVDYAIKLKGPKGAYWRVTISNGLDFELASGKGYAQEGYVNPDAFRMVGVVSKRDWMEGTPYATDLILIVNEKEVYRIKDITVVEKL